MGVLPVNDEQTARRLLKATARAINETVDKHGSALLMLLNMGVMPCCSGDCNKTASHIMISENGLSTACPQHYVDGARYVVKAVDNKGLYPDTGTADEWLADETEPKEPEDLNGSDALIVKIANLLAG